MGKTEKISETKVGTLSDFPEGEGRTVDVEGEPIAVFNVAGKLHAIHNTCLHKGGPLGKGELAETTVTCPWHGWQYDVTSGRNKKDPSIGVRPFEVEVRGQDVYITG